MMDHGVHVWRLSGAAARDILLLETQLYFLKNVEVYGYSLQKLAFPDRTGIHRLIVLN